MARKAGECPVCCRHFKLENLALHVEACLQNNIKKESAKMTANFKSPSPKRPFRALENQSKHQKNLSTKDSISRSPIQPNDELIINPSQEVQHEKKKKKLRHDSTPLAEKMRPQTLEELIGQQDLVGEGKMLQSLIKADKVPNMILWGPPGCGKTTLATIISKSTNSKFVTLSATSSSLAEMKEAVEKARGEKRLLDRPTILFVDEIHRLKKNQQDFFLPLVEDGTITLIGATTENPSFEINNALLSRCRVYTLQKLPVESVQQILQRALKDNGHGTLSLCSDICSKIIAENAAIDYLAEQCAGDARIALNSLEMAIQAATSDENGVITLREEQVKEGFKRCHILYDRNADLHYDCISAFHKSIRGSDPNAALYWLGRMLEGGENPLYVARRLIRIASEDIGLADPTALQQAVAAYHACHFIGMPECDVILAHCTTQFARASKSVEIYRAYKRVKQTIHECKGAAPDVPMHLRNAPTRLMKEMGFGAGYKYNPDYEEHEVNDQTYLPTELLGTNFFDFR